VGVRLAVGQRTLDPYAEVQILDPQPEMTCPLCMHAGGANLLDDRCEGGRVDPSSVAGIVSIIIQLIFLEGILSIDNAAVLGAMVSVLPDDKPVPYPNPLRFLQRFTNRVFGMQQAAALKVGLLGAYLGRGTMLVVAAWVINNPFLTIVGAAYLIKLAFEHLSVGDQPGEQEFLDRQRQAANAFWMVVLNVELADLAFSLDNVVAAVALSKQLWVVMVGVALGIITMRFAAGIFTWLIKKEPILEMAAYIVVLNIGVELLLAEFFHMHFESWQKFIISAATLVLCVLYARVKFLHVLAPLFRWLGEGMGNLNEVIDWALKPAVFLVKLIASLIGKIVGPLIRRDDPHGNAAPYSDPGSGRSHTKA
jgi:tellurite resistance protein TerC